MAWSGDASKLTDGEDNGGKYVASAVGVCAHTTSVNPSWLKVDLGASQTIGEVTVVGRSDCCPQQSNGLTIRIGHSGSNTDSICKSDVNAAGGSRVTITCDSVLDGRYISVWHDTDIVLCELGATTSTVMFY